MHVAIDGVGNHVGGGWSVLNRTVRHLAADDRVSRVSVFCTPLDRVATEPPASPEIHWLQHPWAHSKAGRLGWWRVGLDAAVRHVGADVVLTMNGVGQASRPTVALVQQAFMMWGQLRRVRPRLFALKLAVIRRELATSIHEADAVVVQTDWMRQRVREVLGRKAVVLPLGLPEVRNQPAAREARRVVIVGGDLPYKRHDVARRAVKLAKKHCDVRLDTIDDVHPDEVPRILGTAGALIVASDVESFGLPIVEAFAAGCPVVLTDRPWSRCVAGDAAAYFDHGVPASAARRIVELVGSPTRADELRDLGAERLAAMWTDEPYAGLVDLLENVA